MDVPAIRDRIEQLRADRTQASHDELAQIALRLLAHLEHANTQAERARDLVAAVEFQARAGTIDELLTAALAKYCAR